MGQFLQQRGALPMLATPMPMLNPFFSPQMALPPIGARSVASLLAESDTPQSVSKKEQYWPFSGQFERPQHDV